MAKELLLVAEAVSNEKGVEKEVVFEAIQAALESATKRKYGLESSVRVDLDVDTGEYRTFRQWQVVEEEDAVLDALVQMPLLQAQQINPEIKTGEVLEEELPSVEFGRIAAQTAKQVIFQKVREAERKLIVEQYISREGELLTGIVKKTTRDFLLLDLGGMAEAILSRSEMLPQDIYRPGDRVRCFLYEVKSQQKGPQLFVSRSKVGMLTELFKIEVPEIGEDVIEMKAAARDPGVRAKIAVKTNDGRIDPIGACVGMRGSRVQAVSGELGGERIDIVLWDDNPAQLVINAMSPAEVVSIVMDEETHTMDIAVKEEQLSQAIGKNGQNVKLASELTGWILNVMSEANFQNKSKEESQNFLELFMDKLDLDQDMAAVLVENGFSSLEEVAYVPMDELLSIEGFDKELVTELRNRANTALLTKALGNENDDVEESSSLSQDLLSFSEIEQELAVKLVDKEIRTVEDLADLAVDELVELVGIESEIASQLIMKARGSLTKVLASEKDNANEILSQDLLSFSEIEHELAVKLVDKGIRTVEDLADLAVDELVELVGIESEMASQIIMKAREPWFSAER